MTLVCECRLGFTGIHKTALFRVSCLFSTTLVKVCFQGGTCPPIHPVQGRRGLEIIPACTGREAGYTTDRANAHSASRLQFSLRSQILLKCMFLHCGRKPGVMEGRATKLHTERCQSADSIQDFLAVRCQWIIYEQCVALCKFRTLTKGLVTKARWFMKHGGFS